MKFDLTEIRESTINDLQILKSFEQGVVQYERPFAPNLKPEPVNYYDIKNLIERNDAQLLVATIGENIVGSGYALIEESKPYFQPNQFAYLGFMYVKPEYRGKGINRKIIENLISWAKNKGITEFQLDVYAENKSALSAYEKIGFKPNLLKMRVNLNE